MIVFWRQVPCLYGLLIAGLLVLSGCGKPTVPPKAGGFYGGDRPPDSIDIAIEDIPDAQPKHEPLSRTGNKPYTVLGKHYRPLKSSKGYVKRGVASWYGKKFHGRRTSSGETYNMWAMTAAHTTLPLPTYVEVTNLDNGKKVIVKVNDRGPFLHQRIIDLSYAAAHKLGIAQKGTGRVEVRAIDPSRHRTAKTHQANHKSDASQFESTGYALPSGVSFYIQVAAYSQLGNALKMRKILETGGWPLFPESDHEQISLGPPYRVRVGPFDKFDTMMMSKTALESEFGIVMTLTTD